jgi:hypothetical protein
MILSSMILFSHSWPGSNDPLMKDKDRIIEGQNHAAPVASPESSNRPADSGQPQIKTAHHAAACG